jgi:PD-(D/E)XK nuclease superfamily protein
MLTTNQKGAIAEAAIAFEAVKLGVGVYRPLMDERYDFIFDMRSRLVRVQCKWASTRGDVVVVPLYSCRRTAQGLRRMCYSPDQVDAFAAYSPETERCYFAEMSEIGNLQMLHLRLRPTKNNQAAGIRWAKDYELAATIGGPGPIAQLGERRAGSAKAAGSSPAGST